MRKEPDESTISAVQLMTEKHTNWFINEWGKFNLCKKDIALYMAQFIPPQYNFWSVSSGAHHQHSGWNQLLKLCFTYYFYREAASGFVSWLVYCRICNSVVSSGKSSRWMVVRFYWRFESWVVSGHWYCPIYFSGERLTFCVGYQRTDWTRDIKRWRKNIWLIK